MMLQKLKCCPIYFSEGDFATLKELQTELHQPTIEQTFASWCSGYHYYTISFKKV